MADAEDDESGWLVLRGLLPVGNCPGYVKRLSSGHSDSPGIVAWLLPAAIRPGRATGHVPPTRPLPCAGGAPEGDDAAVPNIADSSFTVYLSKAVSANTKVAWFVVN